MTLIDEFDPQAEPRYAREISGSRSAKPGMLARIMQMGAGAGGDAQWELSGQWGAFRHALRPLSAHAAA